MGEEKKSGMAAANQALRERIQQATDTAAKDGNYAELGQKINQAVDSYLSDLEKHIPNYKRPVKKEK